MVGSDIKDLDPNLASWRWVAYGCSWSPTFVTYKMGVGLEPTIWDRQEGSLEQRMSSHFLKTRLETDKRKWSRPWLVPPTGEAESPEKMGPPQH